MGNFTKEWRPEEVTRAGEQSAFTPCRRRINTSVKNRPDQEVWAGAACGEEVSGKMRVSSTRFVCTDFLTPSFPFLVLKVSAFLLAECGHLSHGSFLTYSREEGKVRGVKGSEQTACFGHFSNSSSLGGPICQGAVFWGSISWTPSHQIVKSASQKKTVPCRPRGRGHFRL